MKTLTHIQFVRAVGKDPAWAAKLTEPVLVQGDVRLLGARIQALSPLLHFENSAHFNFCSELKVAEGTFHCGVSFNTAGIEVISPDLKVLAVDPQFDVDLATSQRGQFSADFERSSLKIATGHYPGTVDFSKCPIESIENLTADQALFHWVTTLKRVPMEYLENPNFHFDPEEKSRLIAEHEARKKLHSAKLKQEGKML